MDKKKEQTCRETDNEQKPVYTGDYLRDSAVSVYEAAAEVSMAIYNEVKERTKKEDEH